MTEHGKRRTLPRA